MKYKLVSNDIDQNIDQVIEWIYSVDKDAEIERGSSSEFLLQFEHDFAYHFSKDNLNQEEEVNWWVYKLAYIRTNRCKVKPTSLISTQEVSLYLDKEKQVFLDYYFHRPWHRFLGYKGSKEINKLQLLATAQKIGINIPETLITTSKEELLQFFHKCKKIIINKSISNSYSARINGGRLMNYTEKITEEFILSLPDRFGLSLFQREIAKKFEVRSFLLGSKFYSMAIFSQKNVQTQTDFRVYDKKKPNRTRSMCLPGELKQKLLHLADAFNLNTGSFDLLVDEDGTYHFLEVNPSGQFGMVSNPCNYYLEREIALFLCRKNDAND